MPNARRWYERNAAIVVGKRRQSKKAKDACVTIAVLFLKKQQIFMWCHSYVDLYFAIVKYSPSQNDDHVLKKGKRILCYTETLKQLLYQIDDEIET